jgi:hypothetical protein
MYETTFVVRQYSSQTKRLYTALQNPLCQLVFVRTTSTPIKSAEILVVVDTDTGSFQIHVRVIVSSISDSLVTYIHAENLLSAKSEELPEFDS